MTRFIAALALLAQPAVAAEVNTYLDNASFEAVGPAGSPPSFTGQGGGGHSAADAWTVFNNTDGTTDTELVPSTLPGGGARMIHVETTGNRNGLVQVFLPYNTGSSSVLAQVRVFVVSGQVAIGTGNGGHTGFDTVSTTTGQWELLQALNGASPANELIVYSASDHAEFYVELASLSDIVLDHFKCYDVRARGRLAPTRVQLIDGFESEWVQVRHATKLCNPAVKCHDGLCYEPQHPEAHLTCYATQGLRDAPRFRRRRVAISNQFGRQELHVYQRSNELCVPTRLE